jgi:hypothetical protein
MKRIRSTDEQIIAVLREHEAAARHDASMSVLLSEKHGLKALSIVRENFVFIDNRCARRRKYKIFCRVCRLDKT